MGVGVYYNNLILGNTFISSDLKIIKHAQATFTGFDTIKVQVVKEKKKKELHIGIVVNFQVIGGISHKLSYTKKSDIESIKTWFKERNVKVAEVEM